MIQSRGSTPSSFRRNSSRRYRSIHGVSGPSSDSESSYNPQEEPRHLHVPVVLGSHQRPWTPTLHLWCLYLHYNFLFLSLLIFESFVSMLIPHYRFWLNLPSQFVMYWICSCLPRHVRGQPSECPEIRSEQPQPQIYYKASIPVQNGSSSNWCSLVLLWI